MLYFIYGEGFFVIDMKIEFKVILKVPLFKYKLHLVPLNIKNAKL